MSSHLRYGYVIICAMAESASPIKEQSVEVLKTVYPIFKSEVYARRQSITWLATGGSATLIVLLLVASSGWLTMGGGFRWVLILGVLVFSFFLIGQIRQQDLRHKQAKYGLIEIEKALEFFEEDSYLPGKTLYPQAWQRLPERDWQFRISVVSLVVLMGLVVLAFLLS